MAETASFAYEIVGNYVAKIRALTSSTGKFRQTLMGSGAYVDKFAGKLGKMSTKMANLRTGFAATMLSMGLKGAVRSSIEFETIMNKVEAVTRSTSLQMLMLREEAKKQGLQTRFSAVQAAEGMEMLGVRGYKTAQILELIPQVLTMATAGDLQMADASQILTGTLKTFSMGTDQASRIVDVYAITAANTAANMTDLNSAMKNFGPLGAAAGMQFEEMAALVGALSDKNVMGSASGTLLMNAIRNLIKPTNEAIETLMKFGFKKDEVTKASGEISDFTTLLELFEKRGIGVGEIFNIFQVRGAKAVAALRGQVPVIREIIKKYQEQSGAGKTMADIMEKSVVGSTHRAISAWQGLKIAIGKGLEPWTMVVQEKLTRMFKFMADRPAMAANLGKSLAILTAILSLVTILGVFFGSLYAVTLGWGVAVAGVALAFSPLFLALTAAAAAITLVIVRWDEMVEGFKAGFELPELFWEINVGKDELEAFKKKHKDKIGMTIMERIAVKKLQLQTVPVTPVIEGKQPLTTSMSTPQPVTTKVIVETVVKGSIDVNDRTGGKVTSSPGAGDIPINVRPRRGGSGGSW